MSTEVLVALLAGMFGLAPIMLQVATARAQRKDKTARPNHLRAELEFLERLGTLHEQVVTREDPARLQTKARIGEAANNLLDEYKALPRATGPSLEGARRSSEQTSKQFSIFRRMFLIYAPETLVGWVLHTLFYVLALILISLTLLGTVGTEQGLAGGLLTSLAVWGVIVGIPLLIVQRLARRYGDQPKPVGYAETTAS